MISQLELQATRNAAPLVSVIVRTMGRPELASALDSLARQSYQNIEVLAVDARGAGMLGLGCVCGPHVLRVVSLGKALPRPAAANAGLDAASGRYITFLDEDDYCDSDHIETLVAGLQSLPECRMAYVGMRVFEDESAVPARTLHLEHSREFLFDRNYLNLQAVLFEKSLLHDGCRFDERFPILEDWDFVLQLAVHANFHRIPAVTANYRASRGNSGAGAGSNFDGPAHRLAQEVIQEKWRDVAEPFRERTRQQLASGLAAQRQGDWAEAERCYRTVLSSNPHDVNALNLAGMASLQRGDAGLAIQLLTRAVAIKSDVAGVFHNLGLALEGKRLSDAAKSAFGRAVAIDPGFAPAARALERLSQTKQDLQT